MTPDLLEHSRTTAPAYASTAPPPHVMELDLFAFALLLLRNLWFILGCGVVAFLITVVVMFRAKPRYASTAVMIVPQGSVTGSQLESQLSKSTMDILGGGYELYGDIILSRTVRDRLIRDFDLKKVYGVSRDESAEDILAAVTKVQTEREGLIRVTVEDTNPQRAADLANDYLRQLDLLNGQLVLTSVGEQRVYLEREMVKEKNALADAEVALKEIGESSSGLPPEALASAGLSASEQTRAQLRAAQIRLSSLLVGETDANPEVVRTRSEIAGLKSQLDSLQSGAVSVENGVPTRKIPEQELEYTRRRREVMFHETLFDLLAKQYESAKQQESKTPSIVQVLDPAVPSLHKAWPPRTYYCMLAGFSGILVGIILVSLRGFLVAYMKNGRNQEKLNQLKAIFLNPLGR
jgi:tyrosine-protein kinase Etk/Wzc